MLYYLVKISRRLGEIILMNRRSEKILEVPEDPIIKNYEIYGNAEGVEEKAPKCPICDKDAEKFYKDFWGEVVGCDNCIKEFDSWEL